MTHYSKKYFRLILSVAMCALFLQGFQSKRKTFSQEYTLSKAECVMERDSRRVLYEHNGDIRLPMASTTKIVTALTVLENCENIQKEICIPSEAEGVEGSSVYLKCGEIYSVEDLLYGLMLRSGNDCATALAYSFGGNIDGFSAKMNWTAQKAGALDSAFKNPHGLPCDGHYTTARDLSHISCYAMQNPEFQKIVQTKYYEPRKWKNKNKILTLCEGGIGIKTGYTKQAGRCLVSAVEREGMTLICTVLSSPQMFERSIELLNDAFALYKKEQIFSNGQIFILEDGKNKISACVKEDFFYPITEEEKEHLEIRTKAEKTSLKAKKKGEIVGQIQIYLTKQLIFSANLYKL